MQQSEILIGGDYDIRDPRSSRGYVGKARIARLHAVNPSRGVGAQRGVLVYRYEYSDLFRELGGFAKMEEAGYPEHLAYSDVLVDGDPVWVPARAVQRPWAEEIVRSEKAHAARQEVRAKRQERQQAVAEALPALRERVAELNAEFGLGVPILRVNVNREGDNVDVRLVDWSRELMDAINGAVDDVLPDLA